MCETNCNHQDIPQPVTVCLKPFLDYRDTTPKPIYPTQNSCGLIARLGNARMMALSDVTRGTFMS
jgi:hypothetical protein